MPAPRRHGDLGTVESIFDDLVFARDAGGLDRCGSDRLAGTLSLQGVVTVPTLADVEQARDVLRRHVRQTCGAYEATRRGDAIVAAAAFSVATILLQDAAATRTTEAIRRAAIAKHGCAIRPDSLRKREQPILQAVAAAVHAELTAAPPSPTDSVSIEDVLSVLKPYAELAHTAVTHAADLFAKRAALEDENLVDQAIAYATFAVARLGVLPVYGLEHLDQIGATDLAHSALGYMLHAMITVPFTQQPDDIQQLATAVRVEDSPQGFYARLLRTPIMLPVVDRFVAWLASHDPKTCQFHNNDVMVGYCSPHYYASICESFADAVVDWASGAFQAEFNLGGLLKPVNFEHTATGDSTERG